MATSNGPKQLPELPVEIWNIIWDYKERFEILDDCQLGDSPIKLRSKKLVYKSNIRMNRLMNMTSYLLYSLKPEEKYLKVKNLTNIIFSHYYFIMINIDIINKNCQKILNLIYQVVNKIYQFEITFEMNLALDDMKQKEKNACKYMIKKAIYFIENLYQITGKEICDIDQITMLENYMYKNERDLMFQPYNFKKFCK